jgi:hypothetical protein
MPLIPGLISPGFRRGRAQSLAIVERHSQIIAARKVKRVTSMPSLPSTAAKGFDARDATAADRLFEFVSLGDPLGSARQSKFDNRS